MVWCKFTPIPWCQSYGNIADRTGHQILHCRSFFILFHHFSMHFPCYIPRINHIYPTMGETIAKSRELAGGTTRLPATIHGHPQTIQWFFPTIHSPSPAYGGPKVQTCASHQHTAVFLTEMLSSQSKLLSSRPNC